MKKIKLTKWKALNEGKEVDEDLVDILKALLSYKDPKSMPTGFKQALMFHRIITAFDLAKQTNELILDDIDYEFFKNLIDNDTPLMWGGNINIMSALQDFNAQNSI